MTDENYEKLVREFPELFQKAGDIEFSINDGWYNIVRALCRLMSGDISREKYRLEYAIDNPGKLKESIEELEKKVNDALEKLPTISQVKEKFGTLRFYVNGANSEVENYITFAETMSGITCEVCGSPGTSRNTDWVRVLCDKHFREQEEKLEIQNSISSSKIVKLHEE